MKLFGDFKDKFKKAADSVETDGYYDEDEAYEDEYEEDENESANAFSSESYSPSFDYDFGQDSSSSYGRSSTNKSAKSYSEPITEKYTKKQGSNIYKMNNVAEAKVTKVVYFVLEDAEDARNIADCMIAKDTVVLADLNRLSSEEANMVLNFLDGVRYICKSSIEAISNIHLIVPEAIELTGDFFDQMNGAAFFTR